jgi:hypothetical protein
MWEVEFTDEFEDWWRTLDEDEQEAATHRVEQLEAEGPNLGRPAVGEIKNSENDRR